MTINTINVPSGKKVKIQVCDTYEYGCYSEFICTIDNNRKCDFILPKYELNLLTKCYPYQIIATVLDDDLKVVAGSRFKQFF